MENIERLIDRVLNDNSYAAAKLITKVENDEHTEEIIKKLYPYRENSYLLGITGAPGVGKSTLTDKLIKKFREQDNRIGVIAVDPTSPFTGGALLGDRVRLQKHATDDKVFIRSMGTRNHFGGLAPNISNVITILSALGCDYIILETVGVGQSEIEVVEHADTVVLVLTPGSGDDIQIMKAGIIEIADIFALNKSDVPDKDKILAELKFFQTLAENNNNYIPPIVQTIANQGVGVDELYQAIKNHQEFLKQSGQLIQKQKLRIEHEIIGIIQEKLLLHTKNKLASNQQLLKIVDSVYQNQEDPYSIANKILQTHILSKVSKS
jgi:LAO/AO transport system kinase